MSLQAKLLGLVAIPAFLLLACERDDHTIGLPIDEEPFRLGFYEHQVLPLNMAEDSVMKYATGTILIGKYTDPDLGEVYTEGYTSLTPVSFSAPVVEELSVADSLVLNLRLNYLYGNSSPHNEVSVKLLTEPLQRDTVYRCNSRQAIEAEVIGSIFEDFPLDFYLKDSIINYSIHLDATYASDLLDLLKTDTLNFSDTEEIKALISGLAFVPEAGNEGIVGINVGEGTNLTMYYTDPEGNNETWALNFRSSEHYNYIEPNVDVPDRPGSDLAGFTSFHTDYDNPSNYIYLQSSTGLGITADITDLLDLADTLENTIITSALLEISDVDATDLKRVPAFLNILLTDDSNQLRFYNDQILRMLYSNSRSDSTDLSTPSFSQNAQVQYLTWDSENNRYFADITLYMQSFLEGRADLTKLWISDLGNNISVSRLKTLKENITIKIYYTVAN